MAEKEIFREQTETENAFRVMVNYNQSLTEMVEAGHYDSFDPNINNYGRTPKGGILPEWTSGFKFKNPINSRTLSPDGKTRQVEIDLVHFERKITSEEVGWELERMGLRPVNLPELLALGAQYPDIQRKFKIVALGVAILVYTSPEEAGIDYWGTNYRRPCLQGNVNERTLALEEGNLYYPDCHFAATPATIPSRSLWQRLLRL